MTVRRHSEDHFKVAAAAVAIAVRKVLARCPPYVETHETEKNAGFRTRVKPNFWLLGTNMTIHLQSSSEGTQVVARTESQSFIIGDVFNFYNRYMQDFLRDLRNELQKQR